MKIKMENGGIIEGPIIGRGLFSTAISAQGQVWVLNRKLDPSKECLAIFCQDINPHIPKIYYEGYDIKSRQVFRMPYYAKLTSKYRNAWEQYKILRDLSWKINGATPMSKPRKFMDCFRAELVALDIPEILKEGISLIIDNSRNYGDDGLLEFNHGNLGIDENGNLILRDTLCFRSSINNARK